MKKWMTEELICPECLIRGGQQQEKPQILLTLDIELEQDDDIIDGQLVCPECGSCYDIKQGIAVVVPETTLPVTRDTGGYGSAAMLSSYLWSHYSEFFNGPDATDAYQRWASVLPDMGGMALDIGCSVGRLTFEMTKTHDRAIGIDTSSSFIRAARKIARERSVRFEMIMEGRITEERAGLLDPEFSCDNAEFIVADALALPFRSHRFATTSSVNILEKVPDPMTHLSEANRVMDPETALFLFSDPFSWDETVSDPDTWIGGRNQGPFSGYGMANLCRLLMDENQVFSPGFSTLDTGEVLWKIRKTRNLWEHITSRFVVAHRGQ